MGKFRLFLLLMIRTCREFFCLVGGGQGNNLGKGFVGEDWGLEETVTLFFAETVFKIGSLNPFSMELLLRYHEI